MMTIMRHLGIIALLMMLFSTASCSNNDNHDPETTQTLTLGYVNVKSASNSQREGDSYCNAEIEYNSTKANVEFYKFTLTPGSTPIDFDLDDLKLTPSTVPNVYHLTSPSSSQLPGMVVSSIVGRFDANAGTVVMTFTVNGTHRVIVSTPVYYTRLASGGNDYATTTATFYDFNFMNTGVTWNTEINAHNIALDGKNNFKQVRITPTLYTSTATGFTFAGDDITPIAVNSNSTQVLSDLKINNLQGEVNVLDNTYSISYTCGGKEVKESGEIY